jgi:hypothetical protein
VDLVLIWGVYVSGSIVGLMSGAADRSRAPGFGFKKGRDFDSCFAAAPSIQSNRLIGALCAILGWRRVTFDINQAYLLSGHISTWEHACAWQAPQQRGLRRTAAHRQLWPGIATSACDTCIIKVSQAAAINSLRMANALLAPTSPA